MKEIKVVQIGTGKMSRYTMRYLLEKGCSLVGAFDINERIIGKHINELFEEVNSDIQVLDIKDLENYLITLKPDIAIVTTMSLLTDVYDVLKTCAKCGVNAITTCEEAFNSYNSNPTLTLEIDKLAKENNCTITGSGYQDIYWGSLISAICSSSFQIKEIRGSSSYNVEDYGIALAKAHGAGLTMEEFDKDIASVDRISDLEREKLINDGVYSPSYMWNVNGWLAKKLGLTITHQSQECIPTKCDHDIYSSTLNMNVKAGYATGMSAVVTSETKEGIKIITQCIGKIYAKEDFDKNEWSVVGEPNTTIVVNRPQTVELTCATVVNRLADVINAKPGFILTCEMDELKYIPNNLSDYLK